MMRRLSLGMAPLIANALATASVAQSACGNYSGPDTLGPTEQFYEDIYTRYKDNPPMRCGNNRKRMSEALKRKRRKIAQASRRRNRGK